MSSATALADLSKLSTEETFKVKSKAMALNLLDDCYAFVTDKEQPASFQSKMEMLKTVAKFGDLEPKVAQLPVGVGFSIKVVYGGADQHASGTVTIDQDVSAIPELPAYMRASLSTELLASLPAQ